MGRVPADGQLFAICSLSCEVFEAVAHTADVAAFPVQPAALRAGVHRRSVLADARWQRIEQPPIGEFQPHVAQGAAAQRIVVPVQ